MKNKSSNKTSKGKGLSKIVPKNDSTEKKDRVFAIASLVCGLLFWVPLFNVALGPMAIIYGYYAIKRTKEDPRKYGGQTIAIIGITLGAISVIFSLIGAYITLFAPELLVKP